MNPPTIIVKLRNLVHRVAGALAWAGPLLVRFFIGSSFMLNGWTKLHDIEGFTSKFAEWHIPAPHFNVVLVACTECFGGALLVIGLLTRIAAIPLIISMLVATISAKLPKVADFSDFVNLDELLYLSIFLWLAVAGAGKISLDYLLAKKWFKEDTTSSRSAA
jgi:putative oxidoreductase